MSMFIIIKLHKTQILLLN